MRGLQCITVELPAGWCFPQWWTEFQGEFGSDQAVISPTVCSTHGSGNSHLLPVSLADNDAIKEVPVFRAGVLPGGLKFVLQLEQGVGDDQLILRAESEEAKTIFIEFFQHRSAQAHPSITHRQSPLSR